jgi:hypothetical protein
MDRHDVRCICAMLVTSLGVGLNLVFLSAMSGLPAGGLVLIPIFAGIAIGLSGLIEHVRRGGRGMVFVERVWVGAMVYFGLSSAAFAFFQPGPE